MSAFFYHLVFYFRTGVRDKQSLMMNYLFPLGFFFMMGYIMPAINPPFLDTLVPVMIGFAVIATTSLGIPDPLVKAREDGIFRSYKINGVPAFSILIIPALTTILHLVIVSAIIASFSGLVFKAPMPENWAGFGLSFIALAVASTGLAVLIGVVSPSTRMTILWSQVIFLPSMLLGGLMLPYSILPDAAKKFSQLLPATHAMNAINGLGMGITPDFDPWVSIGILFAAGVVGFGLAVYLFSWDSKNAVRRGSPLLALLVLLPFVVGMFFL